MATQASDVICSPGPGEQYLSAKRLAMRSQTVTAVFKAKCGGGARRRGARSPRAAAMRRAARPCCR
eukprot:1646587-Prymnesium_polylepis.1